MKTKKIPEHKYYKVVMVVELNKLIFEHWDSGCDETFSLGSLLDHEKVIRNRVGECGIKHLSNYEEISKEEFDELKYQTFTEEGGI